jgi:hypothetical protein
MTDPRRFPEKSPNRPYWKHYAIPDLGDSPLRANLVSLCLSCQAGSTRSVVVLRS